MEKKKRKVNHDVASVISAELLCRTFGQLAAVAGDDGDSGATAGGRLLVLGRRDARAKIRRTTALVRVSDVAMCRFCPVELELPDAYVAQPDALAKKRCSQS